MRTTRLILLALSALYVSPFLGGCTETPLACDASSCDGCCDERGLCQSGDSVQVCGASGSRCIACRLTQTCVSGSCNEGGGGGGSCTPITCAEADAECGTIEDGCGGTIVCGTCEVNGESCGGSGQANRCGPGTCEPATCETLGKNCGSTSDGCSERLNCGTCAGADTCGGGGTANVCGQGCTAMTCATAGAECGLVSDGCGSMISCGGCISPETCGGGGAANQCGQGCVPKTCVSASANCGTISDGCGKNLECGSCMAPQTCGGGGKANTCGALCAGGCPTGFTCDAFGTCVGGNLEGLILDVKVPALHAITGHVLRNAARPTVTTCYGSRARIDFAHTSDERYSQTLYVPECTATTNAWDFSGQLYPGTYKVTVFGSSYSNLPTWPTVMSTSFTVNAAQTGVVFDVPVPAQHTVSGRVTRNGARPTVTTCYGSRARIDFEHATDARYSQTLYVPECTSTTNTWDFTGELYPGSYKVTVYGSSYSNLPTWASVMSTSYAVTAAQTGVVFDVPVPPLHAISGRITRNGVRPTVTTCYGSRARIDFEHATDPRYSQTLYVPECASTTSTWDFTGELYPGTYKVTVSGSSYSNLPTWPTVMSTSFTVNAAQSGVVFDVPVPPVHAISGRILRNGVRPTVTTCYGSRARIDFEHTSDGRYSKTLYVPECSATTNTWDFTGELYPGTYKVTVFGSSYSNLPTWASVMSTAYTVSAAQTGVVFDVPVPAQHTVSGRVTRNGARPTVSTCYGSRARIDFEHATDARYSQTLYVPECTSTTNTWDFTGELYPGTYKVTVHGSSYSNLPTWASILTTSFTVNAARSGVVFDVPVPPLHTVSGRVLRNGVRPTVTTCYGSRARIDFDHSTDGRYSKTLYVPECTGTTNAWDFTGELYPGTYKVTVYGSSYSSLPTWPSQVIERLKVPSGFTPPPVTGGVVISQLYGGGGNSGATFTHDFIELFNPTSSPVSLAGWSLQYGGGTATTWSTSALVGTIAPGGYHLVQLAQGTGGTAALPTPDETGSLNLSATAGKVALVSQTTALSGACPTGAQIADLVGFGSTNCHLGSSAAAAPSNTQGLQRASNGCTSTGDNAMDFFLAAPAPRNSGTPTNACP